MFAALFARRTIAGQYWLWVHRPQTLKESGQGVGIPQVRERSPF